MNRWSRLVLVGAAFWLAVALTLNIAVKALDNVQVSVNAPAEVGEGSDFVARVNIAEVISFGAANYDITYDPDVLEVTNVTNGLIGVTTITVDMWRVVAAGRLRVIGNVFGLGMVSGSGYLAEIHFHTVGTAGSSGEINISNGVLSNSHANEIMATWIGCLVRVSATAITPSPMLSPAPSPTPESTQGGGGGGGYIPP